MPAARRKGIVEAAEKGLDINWDSPQERCRALYKMINVGLETSTNAHHLAPILQHPVYVSLSENLGEGAAGEGGSPRLPGSCQSEDTFLQRIYDLSIARLGELCRIRGAEIVEAEMKRPDSTFSSLLKEKEVEAAFSSLSPVAFRKLRNALDVNVKSSCAANGNGSFAALQAAALLNSHNVHEPAEVTQFFIEGLDSFLTKDCSLSQRVLIAALLGLPLDRLELVIGAEEKYSSAEKNKKVKRKGALLKNCKGPSCIPSRVALYTQRITDYILTVVYPLRIMPDYLRLTWEESREEDSLAHSSPEDAAASSGTPVGQKRKRGKAAM